MDTIKEKIEKGKKIATIVDNIERLTSIYNTLLNNYISVEIYTSTSGNMINHSKIFNGIVWKHIDEIKVDVTKAIDSLKTELDSIVK